MSTSLVTKKPKGGGSGDADPDAGAITNVKCWKRIARKINQLCAHLDLKQPEVLALYEKHMDNDLLAALARQTEALRRRADPK